MPGRAYSANSEYRYGFNGKENDKDISEGGQDYGMRISDNRLGRFLSVDPITKKYPELTPYQFASNTPMRAIDLDGLEAVFYTNNILQNSKFGKAQTLMVATASGFDAMIEIWGTKHAPIKQDVYFVLSENESLFAGGGGTGEALAFTLTYDMKQIVDGKLRFSFEKNGTNYKLPLPEPGLEAAYQDINLSASEGKNGNVSIIFLNKKALEQKTTLEYSETIFHELKAHVVRNIKIPAFDPNRPNAESDHEAYLGYKQWTSPTPKSGTPGDVFIQEAKNNYWNPVKPDNAYRPINNTNTNKAPETKSKNRKPK